jgi:hypothetical protein
MLGVVCRLVVCRGRDSAGIPYAIHRTFAQTSLDTTTRTTAMRLVDLFRIQPRRLFKTRSVVASVRPCIHANVSRRKPGSIAVALEVWQEQPVLDSLLGRDHGSSIQESQD